MVASIVTDTVYTYRFLKLLVTPFNQMEAFKLGLIDADGKRTDKPVATMQERAAYNLFHRLVFNLKRLLGTVPAGKTRIASYVAALALLREHYDIDPQFALTEMGIIDDEAEQITALIEQYSEDNLPKKKKKKKRLEKEEFGTSTADVATIPTPMKFKAFLRRKKLK
jgi:hypothetical protein